MKALSWINFILGIWMIVAGFTLAARVTPVMTEEIIVGVVIAALAYTAAATRPGAVSWAVAIVGLWTLVAPMVIRQYSTLPAAKANDVVVGLIVLVLGVVNALRHPAPVQSHA